MFIETIRDDARAIDSDRGSVLVPAVLVKEHLVDRVRSLRPRDEITLNKNVIYAAYTGLRILDVQPWDILVRPTKESWVWGLAPTHWDFDSEGELVVYFTSGESHSFNKHELLFEVVLVNRTPGQSGVEVREGDRAPVPGHAPVVETKHLVETNQQQQAQPGQPDKSSEAKVQEWLNSPDEFEGKVVKADTVNKRSLPAIKSSDEARAAGPVEARLPETPPEASSQVDTSQVSGTPNTPPEAPPEPPALPPAPREVDGVDLGQIRG